MLSGTELDEILHNLPTKSKNIDAIHRRIKEAAGITWYHNQDKWPVVQILVTDDAPQFDHLAFHHALCWIHAGRSLKKEKLLLVLKYPNIPLHNNESERGTRAQVRKRDVSLHTITSEGTKALDTFLSLKETTRKWGINFFEYLYDRVTKGNKVKRLKEAILQMAGVNSVTDSVTCTS